MTTKYFTAGDLVIELDVDSSPMLMVWRGRSVSQFMSGELVEFVNRVFSDEKRQESLEVHVAQLEHANSQAIGFLTGFIGKTLERTAPTTLVYNPSLIFQKSLFAALAPMVADRPQVRLMERA
jgi:hypothetical protein